MNKCFQGDCRTIMRQLTADGVKVQTIVTSPPYFGLRDYGVVGQIGLEPTMQEYIANMVEVFDVARELLADDGTLWLNLGDSYAGSGKGGQSEQKRSANWQPEYANKGAKYGLKPKDLCGIPWRVAFALQEAGWYLRQDIIWAKKNPMPESVKDRCTKAHEYIFLMSKSPRYYFDADAIKEDCVQNEMANGFRGGAYCNNATFDNAEGGKRTTRGNYKTPDGWDTSKGEGGHGSFHKDGREKGHKASWKGSDFDHGKTGEMMETRGGMKKSGNKERKPGSARGCPEDSGSNVCGSVPWEGNTRNKRSVWTVASQPFKEAHFATFPPALIEPCILAGSKPGDIVFDPFMGSGTVGQVAQQLGRKWLGAELNPDYIEMQHKRTRQAGMILE